MATFLPPAAQFDHVLDVLDAPVQQVAAALAELDDSWTVFTRPRVGQDVPDFVAVHDRHGVLAIQVAVDDDDRPRAEALASRHRATIVDQFFAFPDDGRDAGTSVRPLVVVAERLDDPPTGLADRLADRSVAPSPESLERLRRGIVPGGMVPNARTPARLSADARLVAANPRGSRVRGVTGPAGSGKSFALTARAARLAAEGKDVLVLCFNLTLANRLRALATERCAEYGAVATRVVCTSFHTFCARVVDDATAAGIVPAEPARGTWPQRTLAKTVDVFQQGFDRRYDAILVDEGQDFTLEWWNLLREHVLAPGGEMLLTSDPMVDLGGKDTWADPATLRAAGFDEPWIEMHGCYRMGPDLVESTNEFARTAITDVGPLPHSPDDQADVMGHVAVASRAWRNVERVADLGEEMGRQVVRLLREHPDLSPRDVVFLCEYHHDGLAAAAVIEDAGYPTHHVYSRDPDARHVRKARFWPDADAVKGCTVHSFKGWESPAVVVGVAVEERSRRLAYAAMTRVTSTHDGCSSHLVVVNADPRLASFQPTFELGAPLSRLEDTSGGLPRPDLPGLPSPAWTSPSSRT